MLNLRKTEIIDLDFVVETEMEQENRPFIGHWSYEQHKEALTNEDVAHFIIENKEGKHLGYIILMGILDPNRVLCLKRITIKTKEQGFGKEAMKLIIKWVFENTETHRLWLNVKDFNQRGRHVYETVGFIYEGTLRDCYLNGDKFESLSVMSILRNEYIRK